MKRNYIGFCLYYFVYYITYGAFSPYINVYFERMGMSGSQIGTVTSLAMLLGMLAAPLFGIACDKTKKSKLVVSVGLLASGAILYMFSIQSKVLYVAITYILFYLAKGDLGTLMDGICIKYCETSEKDFSIIRTFGSFGYVFGSFILANILVYFGYNGPYISIVITCYIISFFLLLFLPSEQASASKVHILKDSKELFQNKDFLFILFMNSVTMTLIEGINGFIGNHIVSTLHQSDAMIGLYTFCMVGPELLLVSRSNRLFEKYGFKRFYVFAIVLQLIRVGLYAFTKNIYILLFAATLHAFVVVISAVGNVKFMYATIPTHILATAMSIYGSITMIVNAFYAKIMGLLYESLGSYYMFYMSLIILFFGIIVAQKSHCLNRLDK